MRWKTNFFSKQEETTKALLIKREEEFIRKVLKYQQKYKHYKIKKQIILIKLRKIN